jgi:hypothetical protein
LFTAIRQRGACIHDVVRKNIVCPGKSCTELKDHPWAWVAKPVSFNEEQDILRCLEEFLAIIHRAAEICKPLNEIAHVPLACNLKGLESAGYGLTLLPEPGELLLEGLLNACRVPSNRQVVKTFVVELETFRLGIARLTDYTHDTSALLDDATSNKLNGITSLVSKWAIDRYSVKQIRELLASTAKMVVLLEGAHDAFRLLLTTVGCEAEANLETATLLLETLVLIKDAPFDVLLPPPSL